MSANTLRNQFRKFRKILNSEFQIYCTSYDWSKLSETWKGILKLFLDGSFESWWHGQVLPFFCITANGVDFAGPFLIRSFRERGGCKSKCHECVFVFLTKTVRLEVACDLSSKVFIACSKIFEVRISKPSDFCDLVTDFHVAGRNIRWELRQFMKKDAVY